MNTRDTLIAPDWAAPVTVRALATTRLGGVSRAPYDSLNLGAGVADSPEAVTVNRQRLVAEAGLPCQPLWLRQVHGATVVAAHTAGEQPEADAAWTNRGALPCAVLTADCLPVLLCNRAGTRVAAVHAGWRGLAAGVIEQTVSALDVDGGDLLAWLGPAIGPDVFEVGPEVRDHFLRQDPGASAAFRQGRDDRWLADLYTLARRRLNLLGVHDICGGGFCTYSDEQRFFSYRRDGETGRMATVIWLADNPHP